MQLKHTRGKFCKEDRIEANCLNSNRGEDNFISSSYSMRNWVIVGFIMSYIVQNPENCENLENLYIFTIDPLDYGLCLEIISNPTLSHSSLSARELR